MLKILPFPLFILLFLSGCILVDNQRNNVLAAHANAKLGMAYLQQDQVDVAKSKLLLALKQASCDTKVHDALGYFFAHTGESTLAEEHYLYALKYAYEKGPVCHNYGAFLYQHNRYKEALKYFLLAARDINYLFVAAAYSDASMAALKLKQSKLARQYYQDAVNHDSKIFSRTTRPN